MNDVNLPSLLASVAKRMRLDFVQSMAIGHRGSKGTAREGAVRDFLLMHLPKTAAVTTGSSEIVDTVGNRSGQIDLAVLDARTPPLYELGGVQILPVECVLGLVEVKSMLTWEQLEKDLERIARVKQMRKAAFRSVVGPHMRYSIYGEVWDHPPVFGTVFAYESSSLTGLQEKVIRWCADRPLHELPDSIWVLGKGGLIWQHAETGQNHTTAEPGCRLSCLEAPPDQDVLFSMLMLTLGLYDYNVAGAKFDLRAYVPPGTSIGDIWSYSQTTVPCSASDFTEKANVVTEAH